jgi:hypothetical protein
VSRSIKNAPNAEGTVPPTPESDTTDPDGHEKFLADLGDFTDGAQAARAHLENNGMPGRNGDDK